MPKNRLTIHVVLDRSGSMESIKHDAIGAFNSYVSTIARDLPGSRLSLTIFDSQSVDTIIADSPIEEVLPLTDETYQPRASTPLYDAIGRAVTLLDVAEGKNKALVILTDGEENSSREFTQDRIKAMLTEKQEKANWLVVYLGANQDAFAVGRGIGVNYDNAMNFAANKTGTRGTMDSASASTVRYGSSGRRDFAGFTAAERDKAAK